MSQPRYLLLSDGTCFRGTAFGADAAAVGEIVFNTGMTGYQEVMSDPSYAGQIVTFTYPLIGNYGVNTDDFESSRLQASGVIVSTASSSPSNWRASGSFHSLLKDRGVPGLMNVDTREIALRIRDGGVGMAALCDDMDEGRRALENASEYDSVNYVEKVSTSAPYAWGFAGKDTLDQARDDYRATVVVLDCGVKYNVLRRLASLGVRSIVLPSGSSPDEILSWNPDGILLSPGPGNPDTLPEIVETVRQLLGKRPIFGICLGNQLLCKAVGGDTFKLKFGHRGSNHPVKDLESGVVTITSQNHGYAVDPDSLQNTGGKVTQIHVNDGTVSGIAVPEADAVSIQYHPEAAPGPWDSRPHFQRFVDRILGVSE